MLLIKDFEKFKQFNPDRNEADFENYLKLWEELKQVPVKYSKYSDKEFQKYIKQYPNPIGALPKCSQIFQTLAMPLILPTIERTDSSDYRAAIQFHSPLHQRRPGRKALR